MDWSCRAPAPLGNWCRHGASVKGSTAIPTNHRIVPPANPGTIALVKGIQKMGIQMDRMAGGHGGVGDFADLAKTVQ
jgi:hypothetical protein